jgi:hypothetical protein
VKRTADGLVIENARLAPDKQAEHDRAYAALHAGPRASRALPATTRCDARRSRTPRSSSPLESGATVYGRTALAGVPPRGPIPKIEADGLTCGPAATDGTAECWPVTQVPPPVIPSSDVVIYYDHFDVISKGSGRAIGPGPRLTVRVAAP